MRASILSEAQAEAVVTLPIAPSAIARVLPAEGPIHASLVKTDEAIEKIAKPGPLTGVAELPMMKCLGVGAAQCLAMVPGVSRSGATIMGALAMGIERRTAAEFSFFLAVPTMMGATTLELLDNREALAAGTGPVGWDEIGIGFVVSFLVALVVIKAFMAFVSKSGFSPFAWYRIVAGALAIFLLAGR